MDECFSAAYDFFGLLSACADRFRVNGHLIFLESL